MKNLYHLFVTSYTLRVTSYKLHIARFKRFTSHLLPLTSYLKRFTSHLLPHTSYLKRFTSYLKPLTSYLIPLFCFLPFFALAQPPVPMLEAEVTDVVFSCPGIVTVTYDLDICGPVNVTLSYSPDKCAWASVPDATGAIGPQTLGTDKKITWDAAAHNASFGKLYFKVEYPDPFLPYDPEPVTINGVKWAPVNLDVGGRFCANPEDYGGLFQWGRVADGHECRTSPCWPLASDCGSSAQGVVSLPLGDQVPCPAAPCGYFIRSNATPEDWRTPPDNALWNSGDENNPVKTANDPCPDGWRVPTHTELETLGTLADQTYVTKVWQNDYQGTGIRGFLCIDNAPPYNSLFLPIAGRRDNDGSYGNTNNGYYWCSTADGTSAYRLTFYATLFTSIYNPTRANANSVRCVSEN